MLTNFSVWVSLSLRSFKTVDFLKVRFVLKTFDRSLCTGSEAGSVEEI